MIPAPLMPETSAQTSHSRLVSSPGAVPPGQPGEMRRRRPPATAQVLGGGERKLRLGRADRRCRSMTPVARGRPGSGPSPRRVSARTRRRDGRPDRLPGTATHEPSACAAVRGVCGSTSRSPATPHSSRMVPRTPTVTLARPERPRLLSDEVDGPDDDADGCRFRETLLRLVDDEIWRRRAQPLEPACRPTRPSWRCHVCLAARRRACRRRGPQRRQPSKKTSSRTVAAW